MQVGDVVFAGKNAFKITGIYLGGVGTQNLVGLESLLKAPGYAENKIVEMFVPEELLIIAGVYRRVD